ncbi:MAG: nucleotidyltransferase family protein [Oscillospiraceae bacterium]|nr:nucleotidyltransferase family protein [Oscillospiraceae bacterium]
MSFASRNKLDNIVYRSLSRIYDDFADKYCTVFDQTIMVEAVQQLELDAVIEMFSENRISHLPMKGSILKNMYPMPDMRQQGDIDILVHKKDLIKGRELLIGLGYTFKEHDAYEGHDVFYKDKIICLELHGDMLKPADRGFKRYHDIWGRAYKREGSEYCYGIPKEDIYIFMMLHLIKHLTEGGAGIRMLIDIWLMDEKWGHELNYKSIEKYASKIGVLKAFNNIREIADFWFGNSQVISSSAEKLGEYILNSDIYGSKDEKHFIEYSRYEGMDRSAWARFKNAFFRVFKRYNLMRKEYDVLNKYPWLLPIMWVHRLFRIVFTQREKITDTHAEYAGIDKEKLEAAIEYNKQLKALVGVE